VNQPQPVLRGLANPDEVATILRDAVLAQGGDEVRAGSATASSRAPEAAPVLQPS